MKFEKFLFGLLVIVLVIGFCLSGCAHGIVSEKQPVWDKKHIPMASRDYIILGNVTLEKTWWAVLGVSVPFINSDVYLFQTDGVTYDDLLREGKKRFSETNSVIDVNIDIARSTYAGFFSTRRYIVTGLAIKYVKDPASASKEAVK